MEHNLFLGGRSEDFLRVVGRELLHFHQSHQVTQQELGCRRLRGSEQLIEVKYK